MRTISYFLVVLAAVPNPFSPLRQAELAEKHLVIENRPLQPVRITKLTLFALSDPELVDRKFNVAVVATVLGELARRPNRGLYAFLRLSPQEEVRGVGPSWIPSWKGLL
jgi:hypothetical protein